MKTDRLLEICEHIDRLISVDLHTRRFIIDLYNDALKALGTTSLTYSAARAISSNISNGDTIFILAGFPTFDNFVAEQDGPVGAAFFARTMSELYNVKTIVFTDLAQKLMVERSFMGMGFNIIEDPSDLRHNTQATIVGIKEGTSFNSDLYLDKFSPSMILSVERPSRNIDGKYMSMKGLDLSSKIARIDELIDGARKRSVLTVGIGDGGNEAGCGIINDMVTKRHPNGRLMASAVKTDFLVFASASNLGAYGLSGALCAQKDDLYALPSPENLKLSLEASAMAGLHNGPPLWLDPGTDGIPMELEVSIVKMIRRMIWEELNPHFPKFY